jgi:hypothetical protein
MDQIYIFSSLALLLIFILIKEFKRANRSNLLLRILASVFAIFSLYFIASPITFNKRGSFNQSNNAILLTEGYQKDSLATWKGTAIFSTDKALVEKNKNARYIADIRQFLEKNPQYQNIHIFGYGLENHELNELGSKKLFFHPSIMSDGISSINWSQKIRSGEELLVQGNYINSEKKAIKLLLQGLGNNLDSTIITKEGANFELKYIPKHLGKAVYSLITLANGDTVSKEKLPIFVKEKEAIRVLILASSPNFEYKFLKNWLSKEGYAIAIRTTISKDKLNTEFLNMPKFDLSIIHSTLLEKFDILIGDSQELSRLGTSENQSIQKQLNKGMGLIIKTDVIPAKNSLYAKEFNLLENKKAIPKSMKLIWGEQSAIKNILPGSTFSTIQLKTGSQNLVKNELGDILISSRLVGEGRLILSIINDSYTWVLGNQEKDYSSFWTYLIEKAGRKKENRSTYTLPKIAVIDKKIMLQSDSSLLSINENKIALIQDPILQFEQKGAWWPAKTGWQSIDNEQNWFYVYGESAWRGVRSSEKLRNTKMRLELADKNIKEEKNLDSIYEYKVSAIWFYILFLLCCTYLWLEEKLS